MEGNRDSILTNDDGLVVAIDIPGSITIGYSNPLTMEQGVAEYERLIATVLEQHPNYRQELEDMISTAEAMGTNFEEELERYHGQFLSGVISEPVNTKYRAVV